MDRPGAFEDNFDRLLGLHRLSAREASKLLGVSATTLSYWRNGHREPTTDSLRRVCEFFEINMWTILAAPFQEILPDVERFERVEARIRGVVPQQDEPEWVAGVKRARVARALEASTRRVKETLPAPLEVVESPRSRDS